ncbi:MAG: hypothetical protein H6551_11405 [Chitinophagales bacterium]|nr:hypothetical protein [Chitinophagales bacterium]
MLPDTDAQYRINDLFEYYANGVQKGDVKQIANCYALPCTILSDNLSAVYTTAAKLESVISQGKRFYKQVGIASVFADVLNKQQVTERIYRVKVHWQYYTATGNPVYDCDYYYLVRLNSEDNWKIEVAISIDEQDKVAELTNKKGA